MSLSPISKNVPVLAPAIVSIKRICKQFTTAASGYQLEKLSETENHNYVRVFKHKSLLRRGLGTSDPKLQEQKIINLGLAAPFFGNRIIAPKQVFSFWKLLGCPTTQRGFVEGMLLSNGEVTTGVGGGLCQLANLCYWIFLHSPLEVIEHHHHQFDVFPDSGRVLPFGTGASVFYNYVDLQIKNNTDRTFVLNVWLDETFLHGELLVNREWEYAYSIHEKNHQFYRKKDINAVFRKNEVYRSTIDKQSGNIITEELISKNDSLVMYPITINFD